MDVICRRSPLKSRHLIARFVILLLHINTFFMPDPNSLELKESQESVFLKVRNLCQKIRHKYDFSLHVVSESDTRVFSGYEAGTVRISMHVLRCAPNHPPVVRLLMPHRGHPTDPFPHLHPGPLHPA